MSGEFSFDSAGRDRHYWQQIEKVKEGAGYSTEDMLRHWPAYVMRRDMPG
jgi:hypothetical protein